MRIVLQRVSEANVRIDQKIHGKIAAGLLILVGVESEDQTADVDYLVGKISKLRIFNDEEGKMNLSIVDIGGEVLSISQFTLHANTKKGNRPSFVRAAEPEQAKKLYLEFNQKLSSLLEKPIETGIFGADMKVSLINDGPVTLVLDSKNKAI